MLKRTILYVRSVSLASITFHYIPKGAGVPNIIVLTNVWFFLCFGNLLLYLHVYQMRVAIFSEVSITRSLISKF